MRTNGIIVNKRRQRASGAEGRCALIVHLKAVLSVPKTSHIPGKTWGLRRNGTENRVKPFAISGRLVPTQ
jgi:hypothetical protein